MKTNKQNDGDAALSETLRAWTVNSPLPPRFQDGIWQRIQREESKTDLTLWDVLHDWFEAKVKQPVFAVSYVTVLLVLGLSAGYWRARVDTSKIESGWQARYVQSVDPYQGNRQ